MRNIFVLTMIAFFTFTAPTFAQDDVVTIDTEKEETASNNLDQINEDIENKVQDLSN